MPEGYIKDRDFLGAGSNYEAARVVLVGLPFDATASFRPGARHAPEAVRTVSEVLEEYSPYLGKDLAAVQFCDLGDLCLTSARVADDLQRMEEAAEVLFQDGKRPVFLGGEHLVSYPLVRAAARFYPDLVVVHFDAHADLRKDYLGERLSHATVMRLVAEEIGPRRLYQFGIRSGTWGEFAYGREHTNFFMDAVTQPLEKIISGLKGRPVYVTLDIDVVDPAFAPGTGTPEPGGCNPREIFAAMKLLQDADVVAFDLVEVCPAYDPGGVTAVLAAKIIREALLIL